MGVVTGGGGGGGAAFNGGTITTALKVDPTSASPTPIEIDAPGHGGADVFTVVDDLAAGVATVTDQGNASFSGALSVNGNTQLGGFTNAVQLYITAGPVQPGAIMQVFDQLGGTPFQLDKDGRTVLAVHTAPADASLSAGDCALWFDQTNGASKLMVKGKSANGTVVAAAIALA